MKPWKASGDLWERNALEENFPMWDVERFQRIESDGLHGRKKTISEPNGKEASICPVPEWWAQPEEEDRWM